ncbi:MAG TPA: FG-GAP-like repeat-containing protein [Candidatus Sulfotelmatobacter sp.]|nr:FG-GAP-like repeat-containing protein [Candidatus Sulfotelmatobacter sp.]
MASAPALFIPAPLQGTLAASRLTGFSEAPVPRFPFADLGFIPHYPEQSPLEAVLRFAEPGSDEYIAEGRAAEILSLLASWSAELRGGPRGLSVLRESVHPSIEFTSLTAQPEKRIRSAHGIEVSRREYASGLASGRDRFLDEISDCLAGLKSIETADFEIYSCKEADASPVAVSAEIRYEIVGRRGDGSREGRIGNWSTRWVRDKSGILQVSLWKATDETVCRAPGPLFVDITAHALGENESYKQQLLHGADYWRTVLDGAIGVDVYGNNGVAVGDFDNDGFDDLYVCQAAGLPNRLFRNRGDGTFEDVTEKSGVGVLDFTSCALFADFENRGLQDLLLVGATGPLLFVNDGNGKFSLQKDAFHFARPPQGTFTHAAVSDYNRDGRLDIYFCLYNYYQGLDQYRYPVPYFDARNGPPNYLFRNSGQWQFDDVTEASGLHIDNDRYTFACSWGDISGDGWPDLYVVNDFGRNVLYRNKGDGTFEAISGEAHVDEVGAGMSSCWLDVDNDGRQDIYAAGMWVAAGMRVFEDPHFHPEDPEQIRGLYRRHMIGNSLYRNLGEGMFENVAMKSGAEKGRWSWSADAWDFDNDGFPDLYVANGYLSGLEKRDVSSFFWRQVVAKSPQNSNAAPDYERGWGALNELIRSDSTWNGHERNVFLANNRDGTFSDISGVAGLDFRDDSRSFAMADLDGDGRLEIVLKNRNAPQVRVLRNAMNSLGNSIVLRLRGDKSNRDAIGAAVTVTSGSLSQTKYVQAGSGFLSQHTKELVFGLGETSVRVHATIHWPSGLKQEMENLPVNQRIEIHEGSANFKAKPFAALPQSWAERSESFPTGEILPSAWGTWLIEPVTAPTFSLPDLSGNLRELAAFRGKFVLLFHWSSISQERRESWDALRESQAAFDARGLQIVGFNLDDSEDSRAIQSFVGSDPLPFPVLLGDTETAGVYNIVYRYLFDRHRDLSFPMQWLIDPSGEIVKIYHGAPDPEQILRDMASAPHDAAERLAKAIPFQGTLYQDKFRRNSHTYGVAFFQHGFLKEAERAFQQAVAANPDDADAFYNLGTLYLRRDSPQEAKRNLERAVKLRPTYAEAWNNLGMLAAQQGNNEEAIANFRRSLELRPAYATALLNLGNVYRRQGDFEQAERFLKRAGEIEPNNADISYNLGMLYARKNDMALAEQYLRNAVKLRPDYSDALNNLGVLMIQQQRYAEAEATLNACIKATPDFDQAYLNLARMYVVLNEKAKARTTLEALLQKQPQHRMAQQMLQLLY